MATSINLATQRLQILVDGELVNSLTYTNIDTINPITEENTQMIASTTMGSPTYTTTDKWQVEIVMRDGRREYIALGGLGGDGATWANSYAGYAIAENAIYGAFP